MSAHPFQQFPTLEEYCEWLVGQGGTTEEGDNKWGSFTRLISPDGHHRVVEAGTPKTEVLVPSSVIRLDHRLQMTSPWAPHFKNNNEDGD